MAVKMLNEIKKLNKNKKYCGSAASDDMLFVCLLKLSFMQMKVPRLVTSI